MPESKDVPALAETIPSARATAGVGPASPEERLEIEGGHPLRGEVGVRGAKNAVPKHLVASLLTSEWCRLDNVPEIVDTELVCEMMAGLGAEVRREPGAVRILAREIRSIPEHAFREFASRSRIPVLLVGPLLHRVGTAFFPNLGGCKIGARPLDFHLRALETLGAQVEKHSDGILVRARRLRGATIRLPFPSVGATEQVLLTATLADGVTTLENAAIEPEIMDLICLLQKMGAIISVEPDRTIYIQGVERLVGYEHRAMPDRLEVASWACAAAATDGQVFVRGARQPDMLTFLNVYRRIGGEFRVSEEGISFWRGEAGLSSLPIETDVHPGFMTDWQPPLVVALTQAEGVSILHETVYEDRLGYVNALNAMGATIQLYRECLGGKRCRFGQREFLHSAVISGPRRLHGADVTIPDLRAGFSYVVAALVAEGTSTLRNSGIIRRGYEDFEAKLRRVGAELATVHH